MLQVLNLLSYNCSTYVEVVHIRNQANSYVLMCNYTVKALPPPLTSQDENITACLVKYDKLIKKMAKKVK